MPTCQRCQTTWTWLDAFKKQFNLMGIIKCPYCNETQYYEERFRKQSTIIPAIILALILFGNLLFGPSVYAPIAIIIFIPLMLFVTPFMMKLANEAEKFR